jgi:hypothetical protein
MKRIIAGALLLLCLAGRPVLAAGEQGNGGSSFALGLQLGGSDGGQFSGITARVGRERTIEGVLAFDPDNHGFIVNGNYLVHSRNLFHQDPISALKFYGGFGVGVWAGHQNGFWAQVPLGVDFDFAIPVEASLFIAPGINIVPTTDANVHFGLGIRYWFM